MAPDPPHAHRVEPILADVIDSFEKLEAVVHLYGLPGRRVSADEIARSVGMHPTATAEALEELRKNEVVARSDDSVPRYSYRLDSPHAGMIDKLVDIYANDRVAILNMLTMIAMQRIRRSAAETFADAFRVRRKKDDDG
jgi:hypothetical protein